MGYNSALVIIPKNREDDPFEYVKELSELRSSDEFRFEEGHSGEPGSMQIGGYLAGQFVGKTPRDNPNNVMNECSRCGGHGSHLKYWTQLESENPNDDLDEVKNVLEKIESEDYNIGFGSIITPENKVYGWDNAFDELHSKWTKGEIEREDIGEIAWSRILYILRQYKDYLVVNVTAHE
jgi:hypothetical protein